jgi:enoyl-CoA hydratase
MADLDAVNFADDPRGFRIVTIDRPGTRNAIDREVVNSLRKGIATASGPVVILASSHRAAFSSGADIKLADSERAAVSDMLYALYEEMRASPKIVIAAASGHAVGAGAQLLLASDLRIAAPDLMVRFVGPGHGLAVGAWGLASLVGRGRAVDLCLSMRRVSADEALSIGLIDRMADNPLAEATKYAISICALEHSAVTAVKRVISISSLDQALAEERAHNAAWSGAIPGPD